LPSPLFALDSSRGSIDPSLFALFLGCSMLVLCLCSANEQLVFMLRVWATLFLGGVGNVRAIVNGWCLCCKFLGRFHLGCSVSKWGWGIEIIFTTGKEKGTMGTFFLSAEGQRTVDIRNLFLLNRTICET